MSRRPFRSRFSRLAAKNPARLVVLAFAVAVLVGAVLLSLPGTTTSGDRPGVVTALHTATSAVCVTGLVVVDTGEYWSPFGQAVVLLLIQVGGFGIMTLSSLLVLLLGRRMGVSSTLLAQAEHQTLNVADVRRVVVGVLAFSLAVEAVVATLLAARLTLDEPLGTAAWQGLFHAVSAFNNAGFDLYGDSFTRFASAPSVLLLTSAAVVVGGLGFPVLVELARRRGRDLRHWTLHTRLTLAATGVLVAAGTVAVLQAEWTNPDTFGGLGVVDKLVNALTASVMPRSAGFAAFDYADATQTTVMSTMILMFVGGGSASTAGGIKVTTWALIGLVVWAEARGEDQVQTLGRSIPSAAQRQAVSVVVVALTAIVVGAVLLVEVGRVPLVDALFEATSAFGTVGLSTGITAGLPAAGQLVETALMLAGRVGPVTVVTALALRQSRRRYRLPAERPLIG